MSKLVMVGISHHAAPVEVRERLAIDEPTWRLHAPVNPSTVLVSTCNRVETYAWVNGRIQPATRSIARTVARASGVPLADIQPYLTTRIGRDALVHLVRVTSGLDSLLVGEEQIRGQMREALRSADT